MLTPKPCSIYLLTTTGHWFPNGFVGGGAPYCGGESRSQSMHIVEKKFPLKTKSKPSFKSF